MGPPSKSSHDAAQSNPDRAEAAVCGKGSTDVGKCFPGLVPPTPMPEVPHVINGPPPATPICRCWQVQRGVGSGGKGVREMGGVDGGSGLLRSRSRSRGSFRPGQRQPDSTLREAQLQAAARRLLAGGLTGQLLRLAAAELGSSAREKAEEIAAILEAGSQRAAMD